MAGANRNLRARLVLITLAALFYRSLCSTCRRRRDVAGLDGFTALAPAKSRLGEVGPAHAPRPAHFPRADRPELILAPLRHALLMLGAYRDNTPPRDFAAVLF